MVVAAFKDLCIDAVDPRRVGEFWAAALGRTFEPSGHGGVIRGPTSGHTIWVNEVPESKSVKNRVHLDIYARSLGDLEALGATVLDTEVGGGRWTVMGDVEGGEFCAMLREELPVERLHGLVVDCADPAGLSEWWGRVYGAEVVHHPQGWSTVQKIPGMPIETFDFVPVPQPKSGKNRVHWDVSTPDVSALVGAGATVVRPKEDDLGWHVLADPEGNEFCAFVRP
jgi:hypothetical protein